jgi:outer membrane protein assembly factor BamB
MHEPLSRRLVRALFVPLCALATMPLATVLWAATAPDVATLTLTPDVAPPTTSVTVSGNGFAVGERVALRFDQTNLGGAVANGSGTFSKNVTIPASAKPGDHVVRAVGTTSHEHANAPFTVRTDWTHFRFDENHTGFNPYENVLNANNVRQASLHWQQVLGQIVDTSSPTIANGVAYIGTIDGKLWAVNADGCGSDLCTSPLWVGVGGQQIDDAPLVYNGVVYVGAQDSPQSNDGRLLAYAEGGCGAQTCQPLWRGNAGPQSILQSSPAAFDGTIFVGSFDGKLYAFPAAGCGTDLCDPLWTGTTGGHIESSPTIVDGVLYVGSNDHKLYAFDAHGCGQTSCAPLWTGNAGGTIFDSSPAVADGVVYVNTDHMLVAFDAAGCGAPSCSPLWQGKHGIDFVNGSPAIYNGSVYVGLENGIGVWDAAGCGAPTCPPLWTGFGSGAQAAVISSPAIANGVVYAGRNTHEVLAWNAAGCGQFSCNEIWKGLTNDQIVASSPAIVNGHIYIGSADDSFPQNKQGRLYVYDLPSTR